MYPVYIDNNAGYALEGEREILGYIWVMPGHALKADKWWTTVVRNKRYSSLCMHSFRFRGEKISIN